MKPDARIAQSWVENAPAWVKAVREGLIPGRRAGTDAAIMEAVLQHSPRSVLDAGCGEGWLARALAAHNVAVTGIDGSAALIAQAEAAGGARFLHLSYEQFIVNPSAAGKQFDAVIFNFSLFAADIVPVLRAASSVLGTDGRLYIQTVHPFNDAQDAPYLDGWREESFAGMNGDFKTPMPWYFRTMASWINSVARAGLIVQEVREPYNSETTRPLSLVMIASKTCGQQETLAAHT